MQPMVAAFGLVCEVIGEKMPESSTAAAAPQDEERIRTTDDTLTIIAISVVAGIVANVLHEGVGHGLTALLSGAKSGVLTTVAWSSASDTRLVAAGGTLVNLVAALASWLALRSVKLASMPVPTSCSSLVRSICLPEPDTASFQV